MEVSECKVGNCCLGLTELFIAMLATLDLSEVLNEAALECNLIDFAWGLKLNPLDGLQAIQQ